MRTNIVSKIKKIGIAVLSSLMVLSMGLGFMAMNEKGVAKADGAGEAHFLYRDKETRGSWYPGTATSEETAKDRVYGTDGYFIPYMELVHDNIRQSPGQPVTDLESQSIVAVEHAGAEVLRTADNLKGFDLAVKSFSHLLKRKREGRAAGKRRIFVVYGSVDMARS